MNVWQGIEAIANSAKKRLASAGSGVPDPHVMETIKASARERVAAGLSKGHGNAKMSSSEWLADLVEDAEVAAIREDVDATVTKTLQRTFNSRGQAQVLND